MKTVSPPRPLFLAAPALLLPALASLLLQHIQVVSAQRGALVGEPVCAEGVAMDYFCVARGFLFDNPSVATLEGPFEHSVHCLIEVEECIGTPYEVLFPPVDGGGAGNATYSRGYRLDDAAKADVVALARRVGVCGSCEGGGTVERGLTVVVRGQVTAEAFGDVPPTISGTVALSDPDSPVCEAQAGGGSSPPAGTATPRPAEAPAPAASAPPTPAPAATPVDSPSVSPSSPAPAAVAPATPAATTTTPAEPSNAPSAAPGDGGGAAGSPTPPAPAPAAAPPSSAAEGAPAAAPPGAPTPAAAGSGPASSAATAAASIKASAALLVAAGPWLLWAAPAW
jgi:hypothetical protein